MARQASEIARVLARLDVNDEVVAKLGDDINSAWARLRGHNDVPTVALGEIVLLIAVAADETKVGTLSECAQRTLSAIQRLWPEYAERMTTTQLEGVIADWADGRRNTGKWKSTADLLRSAGVRKSNPRNGAEVVRVEFNRWSKSLDGRSVTKKLRRLMDPHP
jgi:hypothetical protein